MKIHPSPSSDASYEVLADGRTLVDLGTKPVKARVLQHAGRIAVEADGFTIALSRQHSQYVVVQGTSGNDRIELADGITARLEVHGAEGDDVLVGGSGNDWLFGDEGDDLVQGGAGHDYLDGGRGADRIEGGEGRDVLYGLDGDDELRGGAGQDSLDGGPGNDRLAGEQDRDALFGGEGDDLLDGGEGDDALAGGRGSNELQSADAGDLVYEQPEGAATLGSSLVISGSEQFAARVASDLEAFQATPAGRQLLGELDAMGRPTAISEGLPWAGSAASRDERTTDVLDVVLQENGAPGKGVDPTVAYQVKTVFPGGGAEDWMLFPPTVALYHELVHALQFGTGSAPRGANFERDALNKEVIVPHVEIEAVGLPYDHDGDASTPEKTVRVTNENLYRNELGLPIRPRYF